jgi:hypothetical protein
MRDCQPSAGRLGVTGRPRVRAEPEQGLPACLWVQGSRCHHGRVARPWLVKTMAPTLAAVVVGHALVGRESLAWFRGLRRPRMQLPMAGFLTVGALYYCIMGVVVRRSLLRGDSRSYWLAVAVLAAKRVVELRAVQSPQHTERFRRHSCLLGAPRCVAGVGGPGQDLRRHPGRLHRVCRGVRRAVGPPAVEAEPDQLGVGPSSMPSLLPLHPCWPRG